MFASSFSPVHFVILVAGLVVTVAVVTLIVVGVIRVAKRDQKGEA